MKILRQCPLLKDVCFKHCVCMFFCCRPHFPPSAIPLLSTIMKLTFKDYSADETDKVIAEMYALYPLTENNPIDCHIKAPWNFCKRFA